MLVVGSLPPTGRDYDILAPEHERESIEHALRAHEFEPIGGAWIRFQPSAPEVVDLMGTREWGLPDREAGAMFLRAEPLDGRVRLCIPAPADRLLILARKLPFASRALDPKHRRRVQETLAQEPHAFAQAQPRAQAWGVRRRLRRLRLRAAQSPTRGRLLRYLRRPRRGAVVALSGLDGVGKSTQSEMLRAILTKLGYQAEVVWAPYSHPALLRRITRGPKRLLARLPVGPLAYASADALERGLLSPRPGEPSAGGRWRGIAGPIWSTVIVLANGISFRRSARGTRLAGRIVIYDRYVLDAIVDLRFTWSSGGRLQFREALLRMLGPNPRCGVFLDASPETAHARKPDSSLPLAQLRAALYRSEYQRLGLRRLDGELPATEISRQIAREVLETIVT